MPFIGNKPSAVPLTSADIADGIITSAKIVEGTIANADIANSTINLTTKVTGTLPVANGGTNLSSGFFNGISVAELWQIQTSNLTTSTTSATFTSPSLVTNGALTGSAQMTQASGIFTFPSTGYYLIKFLLNVYDDGDLHRQVAGFIKTSTDSGSNFNTAAQSNFFLNYLQSNNTHGSGITQYIFDVTNTSTHKVKFEYFFSNSSLTFYADGLGCTAYFEKLGDT